MRVLAISVVESKELQDQSDERRDKMEEKEEFKMITMFLDWRNK